MSESGKQNAQVELTEKDRDLANNTVDLGEQLTTNQGVPVSDDQNSLRAGARGPTLMEDMHFREKITHFDHERIPERVVHARGAGAHGYFQVYEPLTDLTKAAIFQNPSKKTPVFVRFSTVAGSRGSADTARDVRGFATKFYTDEGVWDIVGNNIPVFFIQDAIKFPDFVHSVKPEPHNEIPQAQSAHDTFWDFVSLTPESTHMLMWVMSDRAIPRSFAQMEGFGVHTFRLVNAQGKARFVKFHWKPVLGVQSLVWDEAQQLGGRDPDYHRRDLWEAIEKGNYPEYELALQIVEEADEFKFDFDLLDATKIIPEELVPVRRVGKMTLNRNPDNYFAETEQVAFHTGHIVSGIDFTNDPLLQGRNFSYVDTQLRRVGPNFAELPINRPLNPVRNNQRDGFARQTITKGRVSYFPNSLGNGCPMHSPEALASFSSYAEKVEGRKIRERSASFADHFSQATLFWNSMSDWEKSHIVDAFSFELNQVETKMVQERVVNELLANVDEQLATRVAKKVGVGLKAKSAPNKGTGKSSPALSLVNLAKPSIKGRKVAILAADGVTGEQVTALKAALTEGGAMGEVVARFAGTIKDAKGNEIAVDRAAPNAPSVIYDAIFVPGGAQSIAAMTQFGPAQHVIHEAFAHGKAIGGIAEGADFLKKMPFHQAAGNGSDKAVVMGTDLKDVIRQFVEALSQHRNFERQTEMVPA